MRIGMTYDLREAYLAEGYSELETAEFDRPDTIDAIEHAISSLGHVPERIGSVRALTKCLAGGARWDLVFNVCEGVCGFGREAQVPGILEAYEIPYTFSDTLVCALTLHKGMTKHVLRDRGLPTPDFAVINSAAEVGRLKLAPPLFVKPVAEGTSKGADAKSLINSRKALRDRCRELIEMYRQPVLVETYLPGREFTLGIIGTGDAASVLGALEVKLLGSAEPGVYSYQNKEECEERIEYCLLIEEPLRARLASLALAAWRAIGCRDAGRVDFRLDASGDPHILEINPLAGMHPDHSDLPIIAKLCGVPYVDLVGRILASAMNRIEGARRSKAA